MVHSFDVELAKQYGIDCAVFLHSLYWWIEKNEANGRHHYDGKTWTYNSMDAFTKLFPYWSVGQIRRVIKKLADCGALHIGNYNKVAFDRTQWYALDKAILSHYTNEQIDVSKSTNENCRNQQMRSVEIDTPIPDNIPFPNPDSKHTPISPKGKCVSELFERFWNAYPKRKAKQAALKAFTKLKPDEALLMDMLNAIANQLDTPQWQRDSGQYIPYPATWLNQHRWEDEPDKPVNPQKETSYDLNEYDEMVNNFIPVYRRK